ncbi:MAG: hypothetical protein QOF22_2384, partial [Bradyrhizobium sp.]|nr:hypothetical protein [Bradyrhizobium sp.]
VSQARLLLKAIDDLDFAAKIHSSAEAADRRTDLAPLIDQVLATVADSASAKDVRIDLLRPPANSVAAIEPELAERLLIRLLGAVIDRAAPGERLRLAVEQTPGQHRISISRPAALRNIAEAQLFDAAPPLAREEGEQLSVSFALRLVRGLAQIAGADLALPAAEFALLFPRA